MKQLKFNAEMAQAVNDGRKTQSRRPMKPQPIIYDWHDLEPWEIEDGYCTLVDSVAGFHKCPYKIGDTNDVDGTQIRITNIRVERLQDISEEDAIAEGFDIAGYIPIETGKLYSDDDHGHADYCEDVAKEWFEYEVWKKLPYKPPYDWNSNPYVWVIEFEVLDEEVKEAQEKFEKSGVLIL